MGALTLLVVPDDARHLVTALRDLGFVVDEPVGVPDGDPVREAIAGEGT